MFTPSVVFAYWMRGSMTRLFYAITSQRLYDGDGLYLHQHHRVRQAAHLHHRRRRLHRRERLRVRPRRPLPTVDVRQVDPRPNNIAERSAGLLERLLDVPQRLLGLRIHVPLADELAVLAPGDGAGHVHSVPHADGAGEADDVLVGAVRGDAPPFGHSSASTTVPTLPSSHPHCLSYAASGTQRAFSRSNCHFTGLSWIYSRMRRSSPSLRTTRS